MATSNKRWRNIGIGAVIIIVLLAVAKSLGWLGNDDALKVSTEKVSRQNIIETVSANGKVQPEVEVKITADVSGELVEMLVKEGDLVKAGMLMCRINPEIYISGLDRMNASLSGSKANLENSKSRLNQAKSQFAKSEANYNRNKKLFNDGVISTSDWESIKSAYEVAKDEVDAAKQSVAAAEYNVRSTEASVKEAKENLSKTEIYAPVDGTVSKLNMERGERVQGISGLQGTEIMRIANLNEMEVSVDVSENDIVRVSLNDTASIEIDAYLDRKFKGIVTEVANSANVSGVGSTDQVTNFTVKIRILRDSYKDLVTVSHPDASPFRPGMSATVDIQTNSVLKVLSLPIQSVTTRDTATADRNSKGFQANKDADAEISSDDKEKMIECVFMIDQNKVKLVPVKTGVQDSKYIEIQEGLKEGNEIVTAPFNAISKSLKNGTVVKVVPKSELFESDKAKD